MYIILFLILLILLVKMLITYILRDHGCKLFGHAAPLYKNLNGQGDCPWCGQLLKREDYE